jgi:hypothetical protein
MLKKVLLGFAVLLLLAVGLVGWTVGRPVARRVTARIRVDG